MNNRNFSKAVEVVCPVCCDGRVEREISIPDPMCGGQIYAYDSECQMCDGRGVVDPFDHEPWHPAYQAAKELANMLDHVADACVSSCSSPSDQEIWNYRIERAEQANKKLQEQMTTLKDWKSK